MADSVDNYMLVLNDGHTYTSDSKLGLVAAMRDEWWGEHMTKPQYKNVVAQRIFELYNLYVDKTQFIDSLVENKLAKLITAPSA